MLISVGQSPTSTTVVVTFGRNSEVGDGFQ
jgi:hypothetical protein